MSPQWHFLPRLTITLNLFHHTTSLPSSHTMRSFFLLTSPPAITLTKPHNQCPLHFSVANHPALLQPLPCLPPNPCSDAPLNNQVQSSPLPRSSHHTLTMLPLLQLLHATFNHLATSQQPAITLLNHTLPSETTTSSSTSLSPLLHNHHHQTHIPFSSPPSPSTHLPSSHPFPIHLSFLSPPNHYAVIIPSTQAFRHLCCATLQTSKPT